MHPVSQLHQWQCDSISTFNIQEGVHVLVAPILALSGVPESHCTQYDFGIYSL